MDHLWTPWRYQYVTGYQDVTGNQDVTRAGAPGECVFCAAGKAPDDRQSLIVHRGVSNFVILNRFPYTSGHVMVIPYDHVATLEGMDDGTLTELVLLARRTEKHLRSIYQPDGLNLGINIGRAAGAGVAGHIHMHVLPRWSGDTNFMTCVGETRVMPEDLKVTWERLKAAFQEG
jgi:ATP adenylyltransferase